MHRDKQKHVSLWHSDVSRKTVMQHSRFQLLPLQRHRLNRHAQYARADLLHTGNLRRCRLPDTLPLRCYRPIGSFAAPESQTLATVYSTSARKHAMSVIPPLLTPHSSQRSNRATCAALSFSDSFLGSPLSHAVAMLLP